MEREEEDGGDSLVSLELSKEMETRERRSALFEMVLKTYAVLGLLFAIVSIAYFFLSFLKIKLSSEQLSAIVFAGTGILLSVTSWLFLTLRRNRSELENVQFLKRAYVSELIQTWSVFEVISKAMLVSAEDSPSKYSLRSVISMLESHGKISRSDVLTLQETLELRNMLVHGQQDVPVEVIRKAINRLSDLIGKLSSQRSEDRNLENPK